MYNKTFNDREERSNFLSPYLKKIKIGKIHSIFNSGFNIEFLNFLIFIGKKGNPLAVSGINISKELFDDLKNNIEVDNIVINKNGRFIFYNISKIIELHYSDIKEVNLKIKRSNLLLTEIKKSKVFFSLKELYFDQLIGLDINNENNKIFKLIEECRLSNFTENKKIIKYLIGRGKGLTPSGDDILMGFTLVLIIFKVHKPWTKYFKEVLNAKMTTTVSYIYLKALLEGYARKELNDFGDLFKEKNLFRVNEKILDIQKIGHSSGNDILFGIFLGLKNLIKMGGY